MTTIYARTIIYGLEPDARRSAPATRHESSPAWTEYADSYQLRVPIPHGLRKKDLSVTVGDGVLRVAGHRTHRAGFFARLFGRGEPPRDQDFALSVSVPEGADTTRLRARWQEGVLVVDVPKEASTRRRSIEIR